MTKLKPQELRKRFEQAERQKAHWRAIYEDAYRYALPNDHQQKHVTIQILVSVRHEEDGSVKWMN